jgi:serine-type D-Ala-D-Ala carboxypeptidase (penicillin-binding protein 5/6)
MTLPARRTLVFRHSLLAVALTFAVALPATSAAAAPTTKPLPKLTAASYLLADLETGEVLAERNPHGRLRPASTLKVLTALTLLPELDPASVYTAVFDDANVEGSKVGVVPDATYTVHNLFQGMFLMSGNDAANALANAGGGVKQTVAAMNRTAHDLGALDTTVVNPSGLDANRQFTSAYDLALIARAALEREDFRAYVTTIKAKFPGKMPKRQKYRSHRRSFEIYTQNKLVLNYRGAIGVKTGWTTKARGTFIGAATRGDRSLVAVVMRTKPYSWEESRKLLDWGFANADRAVPVDTLNQETAESEPNAAAQPLPKQAAVVATRTASAVGDTPLLPWYLWLLLALTVVLASLRARVLLLRRRRRRRTPVHPLLRQPAR